MRIVIALPALALLVGSAFGLLLPDLSFLFECSALVCSSGLALWAWFRAWHRVFAVAVSCAFFAGGIILAGDAWHKAWRPSLRVAFEELATAEREGDPASRRTTDERATVVLTGVLVADASVRDESVSLRVDAIAIDDRQVASPDRATPLPRAADVTIPSLSCARPVRGGVQLTVVGEIAKGRAAEWRAGRVIRAPVQLHRASRYMDPGVPDEERLLARRGITLVGTVKSGALVEVVARGSAWAEAASSLRAYVRHAIDATVGRRSERAAGIVTAIVIGDRAGLTPELQQQLQQAGTYHVIAISGGNIAILAGLTLAAFRVAGILGRAAMVSAILGLVAYAYLVGGGASVDRATLMAVVYFAARALDLRGPPYNALVLVVGLLVATDPLIVGDPAFLLTCGATAAILSPMVATIPSYAMTHAPQRIAWLVAPVVTMCAASAAAEVALFPVSAGVFSRITFAGLVLNVAAIPLMAVTQVAGMLLVPSFLISSTLASVAGWIAYVGAEGLVRSAGLVRFAPFVTWRVAQPNWYIVAGYYVALVASIWGVANWRSIRLSRRVRRTVMLAMTAACLAGYWILGEPWTYFMAHGDGDLHLTFVDVGQGDAAFVRFPRGGTLMIDAGGAPGAGTFDVGDRVVAPVLRLAGVTRLDTISLSHGDADHIGGAGALVDEFRPREVWEGIPVPPFEPLRRLRVRADAIDARWTNLQAADAMNVDGVDVRVWHPGVPDWERQDVRNDDSIVLELRWRDVSVVFTGDIGREIEQQVAPLFGPAPLRIIKVPHHGSATSSSEEFIRTLKPTVGVISVGRSNTFGHPAPAVVQRYRDAGTQILRTDQDGAITIDTDGRTLDIRTFTGRTAHIEKRSEPRNRETAKGLHDVISHPTNGR